MMGATCGAGVVYPFGTSEFTPGFLWFHVTRSLVCCVVFCKSLFIFFWPLYRLSFFDLRIHIIPLVSLSVFETLFELFTYYLIFN
jgi:hypothetical protein